MVVDEFVLDRRLDYSLSIEDAEKKEVKPFDFISMKNEKPDKPDYEFCYLGKAYNVLKLEYDFFEEKFTTCSIVKKNNSVFLAGKTGKGIITSLYKWKQHEMLENDIKKWFFKAGNDSLCYDEDLVKFEKTILKPFFLMAAEDDKGLKYLYIDSEEKHSWKEKFGISLKNEKKILKIKARNVYKIMLNFIDSVNEEKNPLMYSFPITTDILTTNLMKYPICSKDGKHVVNKKDMSTFDTSLYCSYYIDGTETCLSKMIDCLVKN